MARPALLGYCSPMPAHTPLIAAIICSLSALFVSLSDSRTNRERIRTFATSAALLTTLIALGALFGRTLGDFLRGR